MRKSLIMLSAILLCFSCETKISGPIETIPEVTGVQLEWIGYLNYNNNYEYSDDNYFYEGTVWYTGASVPNTLNTYPSYGGPGEWNNYYGWQYPINEWYYEYPCTEIELFQSEGYFNYKYMDSGNEVVQSITLTDWHFWIEE